MVFLKPIILLNTNLLYLQIDKIHIQFIEVLFYKHIIS